MSDFKTGLSYSLMVHGALLLAFTAHGCGGGGQGKEKSQGSPAAQPSPEASIAAKPAKMKEVTLQVEIEDSLPPMKPQKPQPKHANADCPSGKSYGGLGIYQTVVNGQNIVTDAVKGYPGADLGLQFGDTIVSPEFDAIKGEVGTEVNLIVKKIDGSVKTYTVVRDKICLEGAP